MFNNNAVGRISFDGNEAKKPNPSRCFQPSDTPAGHIGGLICEDLHEVDLERDIGSLWLDQPRSTLEAKPVQTRGAAAARVRSRRRAVFHRTGPWQARVRRPPRPADPGSRDGRVGEQTRRWFAVRDSPAWQVPTPVPTVVPGRRHQICFVLAHKNPIEIHGTNATSSSPIKSASK